jgi:hypothetical protein
VEDGSKMPTTLVKAITAQKRLMEVSVVCHTSPAIDFFRNTTAPATVGIATNCPQ